MTSDADRLDSLRRRAQAFERSRGFSAAHRPRALVIAIAVEAGELLSEITWLDDAQPLDPSTIARIQDEMADVLIYLLHLERALDTDLITLADRKMDFNEERFPPMPD